MRKTKMKAFHGNPAIKRQYVNRVRAHAKADEIVKGIYWENGKGCAVGCTIHSAEHENYEIELGIPRVLARLEDGIFEALPNNLAKTWPGRFLKAIKPGADLSKVWPKFAAWLLIDKQDGVIKFVASDRTKEAVNKVGNLYLKSLKSNVTAQQWKKAYAAAYAYAADAAAYAAYAAAYANAYANAYAAAAYAAAYVDAYVDAYAMRTKARIKQSQKLLQLLRECK